MIQTLPLAEFPEFRSRDLDETREAISQVFCSHQLEVCGDIDKFAVELNEVKFNRSAIVYISYGTSVSINASSLGNCFLVQVPWKGRIEVANGKHQGVFKPGLASVVSPTNRLSHQWSENSGFYTVKICREVMEQCLERLLGQELTSPLIFDPVFDFNSIAGKRWCNAVEFVLQQVTFSKYQALTPTLECELEDMLCVMLLESLHHNYYDQLNSTSTTLMPKSIKRAKEYIYQNLKGNITVADIAAATAVSPATLAKHFRQYLGQSPMQYVRVRKLTAVHNALRESDCDAGVSDLALEYGFNHLGRFSEYYRKQYGQAPSITLRQS